MAYDKYANWPLIPSGVAGWEERSTDIKEQVLKDLSATGDEIDRLEILDSFEVWVKRRYRAELSTAASNSLVSVLQPFITAGIRDKIPDPYPFHRGRPV